VFIVLGCSSLWRNLKPRVGPPHRVDGGVIFEFFAPSAHTVTLAGDFNRWGGTSDGVYNPNIDRMYDDGTHGDRLAGDGIWTIIKELPPGKYQYKFVVDGTTWYNDPSNPETQEEGGFINSVIRVK
jgi:1,4-alpha-glucan branching enzyme